MKPTEMLLLDRSGYPVAAITNLAVPERDENSCDSCGERYEVGDWPFCPHGKPTMVVIAHGEIVSKHLGGMKPMRFGSRREEERYMASRNIVRLDDCPVTEGERNALERAKERAAREAEGRPDKINPLHESERV